MKLSKLFLSLLLISLVLLSTSCDKENVDERPDLPPVESMVMDFDDFQTNPTPGTKGIAYSYTNFAHAFTNVAFWNAFTTISLAVPVTSYGLALQQTPEYIGDDTWEWSYDFEIDNDFLQANYTATLTGQRLSNETFSMEMNIASSDLPALKMKYFDGVCRYDHTHAEWNLYVNAQGTTVKVLEVEWTKDYETDDASMKYTYVEPGMNETDSFIFWEYDADEAYDASYTIDLSAGVINIEWDTDTKAGRIMNPLYFENSDWHCWNDQLQDIECPI